MANHDPGVSPSQADIDGKLTSALRRIAALWAFGLFSAVAFFIILGIMRSDAKSSWSNRLDVVLHSTVSTDDSAAALAAGWIAIPVMLFTALAVQGLNVGGGAGDETGDEGVVATYVLRAAAKLVYFFSAVGLWTLLPQAARSPHPIPDVFIVLGGSLLTTTFFVLDVEHPATRIVRRAQAAVAVQQQAATLAGPSRNPASRWYDRWTARWSGRFARRPRLRWLKVFARLAEPLMVAVLVGACVAIIGIVIWYGHGHVSLRNIEGFVLMELMVLGGSMGWSWQTFNLLQDMRAQKGMKVPLSDRLTTRIEFSCIEVLSILVLLLFWLELLLSHQKPFAILAIAFIIGSALLVIAVRRAQNTQAGLADLRRRRESLFVDSVRSAVRLTVANEPARRDLERSVDGVRRMLMPTSLAQINRTLAKASARQGVSD